MAEKHQQVYPLAPANGHTRSDEESAHLDAKELKRKKRIKLAIYIAIFAVFQVIVITVFGLVVMRAKSPKFRLSDIEIQNLETSSGSPPSFDINFNARVRVKNSNFGPYKFDNTTIVFAYGDTPVGEVAIPKSKAGFKSTKKINVKVNLSSSKLQNTDNLSKDLKAGTLTFSATAKMTGKAELMLIMKKKKSTDMNCTITIDINQKKLKSLECK